MSRFIPQAYTIESYTEKVKGIENDSKGKVKETMTPEEKEAAIKYKADKYNELNSKKFQTNQLELGNHFHVYYNKDKPT